MNSSDTHGGVEWEGGGVGCDGWKGYDPRKTLLKLGKKGVEIRKILLSEGRVIYSKKLL